MEFNKAYNRNELVKFLRTNFLPEDFIQEETTLANPKQFQYTLRVTRLGECNSLELVVFEVLHSSVSDARVGLTKEAFRMLADEFCERALVFFVPQDDKSNYRFSLIEITLEQKEGSAKVQRTFSNPHRYSYYLGEGISYHTPNKYLNAAGRVVSIEDLRSRFSVEVLTKAFYQELSDWYAWAVKVVRFPNVLDDKADNEAYNSEAMIRLITRLIFVWFIKQRHLVPDEFFDEKYISDHLLKSFTPNAKVTLFGKADNSYYYKGILQNLFFAMLNSPITPEGKDTISERRFRKDRSDYDNNKLMRHKDLFQDPQLFVELANRYVPFLNGGLFDCLDDKDNGKYFDAFTDREEIAKQLIVPDYLFFGEDVGRNIDLSEWYGDKRKKKVSARGIIDILKRYNFTVEENTPFDQDVSLDPELLGKVFENLLASYNPETQTTARKQTGSFYTPREIVQYMVDESLVAHLKRTVGDDLEAEYRKLIQYTDEEPNLTDGQRKAILQSIYQCKVLDPACGSGAFPMGMLQQMVHILNRIDPDNKEWKNMMVKNAISETSEAYLNATDEERKEMVADIERSFNENVNRPDYARKLYLIENCIYGVDIQPIAIQISKLRFFISLVVDQKTNDNPVDNFGIRPLPNLEAKFVAANTLIGLHNQGNLFVTDEIRKLQEEMKIAKHKIFGAKTVKTKRKYRESVADLRLEMVNKLNENGSVSQDDYLMLLDWDMFDQNKAAKFFDSEWMFDTNNSFDIIIANPPYVDAKKLKKVAPQLKVYKVFNGSADLYTYFYEFGLKKLCSGGTLTFITSNKWIRSEYGRNLRRLFLANHIDKLIDFGRNRLFNATVDTNVIIVSKEKVIDGDKPQLFYLNEKTTGKNIYEVIEKSHVGDIYLSDDAWLLNTNKFDSLKDKIEGQGLPLNKCGVNIFRGILTGCNKAYHIDTEEKNRILKKDSSTQNVIKPLICGGDTDRYYCRHSDLWLINVHNGVKGVTEPIIIDKYPVLKQRLDEYHELLVNRNDKGTTPYNLRNCAYLFEFEKEKIIWQAISKRIAFSYDSQGYYYCDVTTYFMTGKNLKYILAILNSKLFEYTLLNIYLEGDTFKTKNSIIQNFPIPIFQKDKDERIINLVDNILTTKRNNPLADTKDIENQIDLLVYRLYGLTYDEVVIVDPETPITREEYESQIELV